MKRRRNLLIMAIVLVVLCVVIGVEQMVSQHVDSINTTDEIILSVDQENITNVTWTYEDETLTFENVDGVWYDSDDGDFPVNQDTMEDFLSNFEEVHACFIIDDVEDYDQYGLEEPQCTVTITIDGEDTVVSMGNYSTMDEQRYISIDDGKVYLIEDDLLEYVTTDRDEFMQQDEIPALVQLEEMTVSGDAALDAVYDEEGSYAYTDSYNYYQVEDGEYLLLDDSLVEGYLDDLASAGLTDYITYTATDEDLAEYGLDDPTYTIVVKGTKEVEVEEEEVEETEEDTSDSSETEETEETEEEIETEAVEYTVYISVIESEAEDTDDSSDSDEEETTTTGYLRVGDSSIIYQLSDSDCEALVACDYDSLRPTDVLSLDWEAVTSLSFTIDGETCDVSVLTWEAYTEAYEVDEEEEEETDFVYMIGDTKVNFDDAVDAVEDMSINAFTDDTPGSTLEMSATVNVDKADYPSVTVEIYQYDGDNCLVVIDGETVGLMSRSLMVNLREAVTSVVLGME